MTEPVATDLNSDKSNENLASTATRRVQLIFLAILVCLATGILRETLFPPVPPIGNYAFLSGLFAVLMWYAISGLFLGWCFLKFSSYFGFTSQDQFLALKKELSRLQNTENIGLMTAGVAHNFRNYLGILESTSELIRKAENANATVHKALSMQHKCLDQARHTVDLLMQLAKQEDPSQQKTPVARPVREVIEESLELAELLFKEKELTIEREIEDSPHGVQINDIALMQSLINILKNAAEASNRGSRLLVTSKVCSDDSQKNLCISVTDFGVGFDPKTSTLGHGPVTSSKSNGSGFGLMTVKTLVENDGGKLQIKSKIGQGTQVSLYYPVHDS